MTVSKRASQDAVFAKSELQVTPTTAVEAGMGSSAGADFTRGGLLAKNVLTNLVALMLPALTAVFTVPLLVRHLGTARFGVLTIAWLVIGYFSLFDFGLARALTKLVAESLGANRAEDVPQLVWTALLLMIALGVVGGLVAASLAPWIVHRVLHIPPGLRGESLRAIYLLAASVPVVIVTGGLRGVLEAYQYFFVANAVRLPMGLFTYLGPLLVLPFSHDLFWLIAALFLARAVACAAHVALCFRFVPSLRKHIALGRSAIRPLVTFGSWATVSNVVAPLLTYLDRFMVAAIISVVAATYYGTPSLVASNLLLIPLAVMGVMFPAFAASLAWDPERTLALFSRTIKFMFLLVFPIAFMMVLLAADGLHLWLGSHFALQSTSALQWMAAAVLLNSIGQIPFAALQAAGRPDLTAKLHLVELPLYIALTVLLIRARGIEGAAMAWAIRFAFDALLLFVLTRQVLPETSGILVRTTLGLTGALMALAAAAWPVSEVVKLSLLTGTMASFSLIFWFGVLSIDDREGARRRLMPSTAVR